MNFRQRFQESERIQVTRSLLTNHQILENVHPYATYNKYARPIRHQLNVAVKLMILQESI